MRSRAPSERYTCGLTVFGWSDAARFTLRFGYDLSCGCSGAGARRAAGPGGPHQLRFRQSRLSHAGPERMVDRRGQLSGRQRHLAMDRARCPRRNPNRPQHDHDGEQHRAGSRPADTADHADQSSARPSFICTCANSTTLILSRSPSRVAGYCCCNPDTMNRCRNGGSAGANRGFRGSRAVRRKRRRRRNQTRRCSGLERVQHGHRQHRAGRRRCLRRMVSLA